MLYICIYVYSIYDDYLGETKNQLNDKNIYKELTGDVAGPLEKNRQICLQKNQR